MNGIQIRIGDVLYAVAKRWKMVLALTLVGVGAGIALNVVSYMQGENRNYEVSCSVAVTSQSGTGAFTGNSSYLNPSDFYLAQDMVDAVTYVIESDRVLAEAIHQAGLLYTTPEDVVRNLRVERYNETQILELTLYWSGPDEGTALMNAILNATSQILPETLMVGTVSVIDEPQVRYLVGGIGYGNLWRWMIVLGFLAGIGLTVLDLIMRPTLLNLKDVENVFGLEQIGTIPWDDDYFNGKQSLLVKSSLTACEAEQNFMSSAHILRNLLGSKEDHHCFYVTSTEDGEGKTTVAAHIAVQLSDMEKRVLLLDMDLRNPSLGGLFLEAVDYSRSLNALYKGEATVEEAVIPLTGYLDFMPAILERTTIPIDGTLIEFIRQLSEKYEYVIIDAPPVGRDADALSLNQIAHTALFVIRYDKATVFDIQKSIEKLDKSGTRILGCIVNGTYSMGGGRFLNRGGQERFERTAQPINSPLKPVEPQVREESHKPDSSQSLSESRMDLDEQFERIRSMLDEFAEETGGKDSGEQDEH